MADIGPNGQWKLQCIFTVTCWAATQSSCPEHTQSMHDSCMWIMWFMWITLWLFEAWYNTSALNYWYTCSSVYILASIPWLPVFSSQSVTTNLRQFYLFSGQSIRDCVGAVRPSSVILFYLTTGFVTSVTQRWTVALAIVCRAQLLYHICDPI
jgi:hypothetical protein